MNRQPEATCLIEGCEREARLRRLCPTCYERERHRPGFDMRFPKLADLRPVEDADEYTPAGESLVQLLDRLSAEVDDRPRPCRRGCCWTPFNLCARRYGCACHTEGIAA